MKKHVVILLVGLVAIDSNRPGAAELSIIDRVARASKSFSTGKPLRHRGGAALEEQQARQLEQIDAQTQAAYAAAETSDNPPLKRRQVKLAWAGELDKFLQDNPGSPFDADICIELGKAAHARSAYKKAIQYYARAWDATKGHEDLMSGEMAREASGALARLLAATGRMDDVEALEKEAVQFRHPTAGNGWWWAREVKAFARKHPSDAYKCGIFSLERLARMTAPGKYKIQDIMENESSPAGFSASELVQIAGRAGVPVNSVFVTDWTKLPLPAVLHLTSEHFVTVSEIRGDFFKVQDSVFGAIRWLTLPELAEEATGCILISQNQVGAIGTRVLSASEANAYRGRCHFSEPVDGIDPIPIGPPITPPPDDFPPPGAYGDYPTVNCCGMPFIQVTEPTLSAWTVDRPLVYVPPLGPAVHFTIAHSVREVVGQFTSSPRFGAYVGLFFKSSWLLWAELDASENSAEVILPNGSREYFEFNGSNTSEINYRYNNTLEKVVAGGVVTALKVHHINGATLTYAYKYMSEDNGIFHITSEADKAGNATTFAYDSSHYLTNVVAADGVSFQLQYGYNPSGTPVPDIITNVVASYGASVSLEHGQQVDAEMPPYVEMLSGITDPAGIVSRFEYTDRISMRKIHTPYGVTEYAQDSGAGGGDTGMFDRTLIITHPNGDKEFWSSINEYATGDWPAFDTSQIPSSATGTLDSDDRHNRNTFHWTPDQWNESWDLSSTNDYNWATFRKARIRHWLTSPYPQSTHFDTLSWEQSPGLGGGTNQGSIKWYDYANKTNNNEVGAQIRPAEFVKVMPDGTTTYKTVTRNTLGKPTLEIEKWDDGSTHYRTNSFTYSADGIDLVEHRFDPSGVNRLIVGYGYDISHPHLPVLITNALGEITSNTYDSSNRLVTVTTPSGLVVSNTYGGDGFISKTVEYQDGVGPLRTNSFTYQNGLVRTHTDPRGLTITNTWDYLNRLTRIDFPDSTYIAYAYTNGVGTNVLHKTYERDRLGNTKIYEYDSMQRMFKQHDELDRITAYGFCTCGSANYITNALGTGVEEVTHYVFDDHHKLIETYRPDGTSVTNAYDAFDRLTVVSDALGSVTNTYDNLGRLVAVSNYFGLISQTVYDDDNRIYSQTDANGVTVTNTYDALGRILTRTHPDGGVEAWGYTSGFSGPTSYTNQLSKVSTFVYDVDGRTKTNTVGGLLATLYTYNPAGDLATLTDGNSHATTYGLDEYGRLISKTYANGTVGITNGYDADGHLTARWTVAKGKTVFRYDAVGNLTNVDYPSSTDLNFEYDALNRVTKDYVTNSYTSTYTYYPGGALKTEDGPFSSDTLTYYTNAAGLKSGVSIQQPAGSFTNGYFYDAAHRLSSIVSHSGTYTYDYYPTNGGVTASTRLLRKLSLPPGSYITNSFDNDARETETRLMTSGNVELNDHAYVYNAGNQRTQQTFTDDSYVTYTYDDASELRTAYTTNISNAEIATQRYLYGYDSAWNMLKRTNNTSVSTYTVNNLDQVTSIYSYDSNGNPTSGGTMAFDDENRLISSEIVSSAKYLYFYDARGRLRKREEYTWNGSTYTGPTATITYVYDGMLVIQERNASNVPQVTYTRGPDLRGTFHGAGGISGILARSTAYQSGTGAWNTHQFYHADANGNVTYLMTSAQALAASYRYDPFGRTITSSGTSAGANTYRFSSKEIQPMSGFYYYGNRFYNPVSQRWLNRDPGGEKDGLNLYAFLGNDGVNSIDLFGLLRVITFRVANDSSQPDQEANLRMQILGMQDILNKCQCTVPHFPQLYAGIDFAHPEHELEPNGAYYDPEDTTALFASFSYIAGHSGDVPTVVTKYQIGQPDLQGHGRWIGYGWTKKGILLNDRSSLGGQFVLAHELGHYVDYRIGSYTHSADPFNLMYSTSLGFSVGLPYPYPDAIYCEGVRQLAQ